jgi:hypothetical protein
MSSAPTEPVAPVASDAPTGGGAERLPDVEGLPAGAREVSPLFVMLLGTAVPVGLVALACTGGSTFVLVLAVLALIIVGAATMVFMTLIMTDPEHPHNTSSDSEG